VIAQFHTGAASLSNGTGLVPALAWVRSMMTLRNSRDLIRLEISIVQTQSICSKAYIRRG